MKVKSYATRIESGYRLYVAETGTMYNIDGRKALLTPDAVASFATTELHLHECAEEYVYVLCLNTNHKLIGLFEVSHGNANKSFLPIRETMQKALLLNASAIILLHNHPSGTPTPSENDIDATNKIAIACNLLEITCADHIIISSETNHYSFRDNGKL